ncbi:glycosyltransferase 87 family protein [Clostridium akagii]|uniref:glycosyltransferase 87 family protein n=1 Tax=Clostridium akagii TaxID=91623 RepID=UPI0004789E6E|nr:glycosyltransferase family 39 protein [Clostridium akagii]
MNILKKNMVKVIIVVISSILLVLSVYMIYNYNSASNSNTQSMGQQQGPPGSIQASRGDTSNLQKPKTPNTNKAPSNKGNIPQQSGQPGAGMGTMNSSSSSSTKYLPSFIAYTVMFFIIFISALLLIVYKKIKISKENIHVLIIGILVIGFLLRTASALIIDGQSFDISTFRGWANTVSSNLLKVYENKTSVDYPPLYLYVLYIIGKISKISILGNYYPLLLKLPSIITDVLSGYLIYKTSKTRVSKEIGIILAAAYIFNPAILINSTIWGQVDSFFTLLIMLALFFLSEDKIIFSTIFFALAVFMKPQGIIFLPILLFAYIKGNDIKTILKSVITGIITGLIVIIPFSMTQGIMWIFKLYISEASEYPYASDNAFNFYSLIGANRTNYFSTFFIFDYHTWGMIAIVLVTIFSGYIYIKGKDKSAIFIATLVEIVGVFNFSVGMHERYMFTAVAISILAYIYSKDRRLLFLSAMFTLTIYVNTQDVLSGVNVIGYTPVLILTSLLNVLGFAYLAKVGIDLTLKKSKDFIISD